MAGSSFGVSGAVSAFGAPSGSGFVPEGGAGASGPGTTTSAPPPPVYPHGVDFESSGMYGEAGISAQMKAQMGMGAGIMTSAAGSGAVNGVHRGAGSEAFSTKPKRVGRIIVTDVD